jgi:predicted phosphodiesterase
MYFSEITVTGPVMVIGDTHTPDIYDLLNNYNFQDYCLIHVGDFGVGFFHKTKELKFLQEIQNHLEENNGKLLVIHGNHDDPEYFNKHHWANQYKNIEFVEDYSRKIINGKQFLFAGGATSIDRQARTAYRDYWPMEKFILPKELEKEEQCDILITHTSAMEEFPNDGFANIVGWFKNDPTLRQELVEEREKMTLLYNQVKPNKHYYGHFHNSNVRYVDGRLQQCLDINEMISVNI